MQTQQQATPEMVGATADEIALLADELRATIGAVNTEKQILRRYTIAEELRRIAELVAKYGDELV